MRVESANPSPGHDGATGWIHVLDEKLPPVVKEKPKKVDAEPLAVRMFNDPHSGNKRAETAKQLGVSVESLEQLFVGVGWDGEPFPAQYSSWPCRNERGKVIGITRRYSTGKKLTYPGTSNGGVFAAMSWWETPGDIWIVEGGSDVAACITHGICAIGRPSNVGGGEIIKRMLQRRAKGRTVIVIGENDRKEKCPANERKPGTCRDHCRECWPGLYGARSVAKQLDAVVQLPPPGVKDAREHLCGE